MQNLKCKQENKALFGFLVFIADCHIESGIEIYDIISTSSCLEKYRPNETVDMSGGNRTLSNTEPQVWVNVISKISLQESWQ